MEISDLKYGDKLYCYKGGGGGITENYLKKGNWYKIKEMNILYNDIFPDGHLIVWLEIFSDEHEEGYEEFTLVELKKYFYTTKEVRKFKIKKIENES